ncbi:hypothetical protein HPB50_022587 [Hyalomma asiaticum]|uniref:Uncharacterized protein n=1 Tax=Hyalomma asiaticum TaxID=266040 RepID=A0ACB7SH09_HYAAI|nr:hypothetical protein HPB50_022587 [Hyalomma asiaticum]
MDDFSTPGRPNLYGLAPSKANFIYPGKRPMSSMAPMVLVNSSGKVQLALADVSKGEENKDTFWEFSDTTAETPTAAPAASEAALPVRRYPMRNRRAPDRYTPS